MSHHVLFGGAVDGVQREGRDGHRGARANVNDGTPPARQHPRQHRGRDLGEPPQVHPYHPHKPLDVRLVQVHRARRVHRRVVHQHPHVQPLDRLPQPPDRRVACQACNSDADGVVWISCMHRLTFRGGDEGEV